MSQTAEEIHLGAAILGFYAGIKLARKAGYRESDIFQTVREKCFDGGEFSHDDKQIDTNTNLR